MMSLPDPTPLKAIELPSLIRRGINLWVKRDDLIHPLVSGNKWRKLKFNLRHIKDTGQHTLLTFGGAYSNHLYATAAAGKFMGIRTIGVVRGEPTEPMNPTLAFAQSQGMILKYISRERYGGDQEHLLSELRQEFGDFYPVPAGGSNSLALPGVAEMVAEIKVEFDYICTAVGTGGTLAGIVSSLSGINGR